MAQLIFPPLLINLIAYAVALFILMLGAKVFSLTDQCLATAVFIVHMILGFTGLYIWYSRFLITDNCQTLWTKLIFKVALVTATALSIYISFFNATALTDSTLIFIRSLLFLMVPNLGISLALIDHFEKIHKLKPE